LRGAGHGDAGINGLELQQTLSARGSALPIIFLTGRADVPMCVQAMNRGAADFLTKPVKDTDLFAAIRRALEHDRNARQTRAEREDIRARVASLTPRERDVLKQVVTGQLNKQIACNLGTVEKTIKVHRGRVMEKMRVTSVANWSGGGKMWPRLSVRHREVAQPVATYRIGPTSNIRARRRLLSTLNECFPTQ
jgi:FixJ family two-component response regulator